MNVCVLLCRDCCCGTERKHPEIDHDAQEQLLRTAAAAASGKLIRTRCLGVCEHSNVVVVKTAGQTHWFGDTLSPNQTAAVAALVGGQAAPPTALRFRVSQRGAGQPCVQQMGTSESIRSQG
jgi:(2Fe-2S) ferredoxin